MKEFNLPLLALACVLSAGLSAPVQALECPLPQHANGGAVLLSPDETHALGQRLIAGHTGNSVPEAAAELRAKDPGISTAEIVDTISAAYCAAIASEGLEESVAKAKVRAFALQALDQLKQ